ncbi:MAG: glycosyltransferase [Candidatus Methanoperedens sp.]|nr:glycosyltransferase [Candidatus Methanoperedens sp.]
MQEKLWKYEFRYSFEPGSMNILIYNWRDIRNPAAGGTEVFTHEIARRWVERGNEVTLFTSAFAGCEREEEVDGVRIIRGGVTGLLKDDEMWERLAGNAMAREFSRDRSAEEFLKILEFTRKR